MANSRLNLTYRDYDDESSQCSFRGREATAANFVEIESEHGSLVSAVEAVVLGNLTKRLFIATESKPGSGPSANSQAQREMKWLVRATDDVTGDYVDVSLPCPDTSLLLPNSNQMDPSSAGFLDLKAAVEAYHQSKGGNAVTVQEVVIVGRNL